MGEGVAIFELKIGIKNGRYLDQTDDDFGELLCRHQPDRLQLLTGHVLSKFAARELWHDRIESEALGMNLFHAMFTPDRTPVGVVAEPIDPVLKRLKKSFDAAVKANERLRLVLRFDKDDLPADGRSIPSLPWEFMYVPPGELFKEPSGVFLGTDRRFVLCRQITEPLARPVSVVNRGIRILVLVADPRHMSADGKPTDAISIEPILELFKQRSAEKLDISTFPREGRPEEERYLSKAPPKQGEVQYLVVHDVTKTDLALLSRAFDAQNLSSGWDVIHFCGHATFRYQPEQELGGGVVRLAPGKEYDDDTFTDQIANRHTLLVVLQSCEAAHVGESDFGRGFGGLAPVVARKIPSVIAMQYQVFDVVSNRFAVKLYSDIFDHQPADVATQNARALLAETESQNNYASREFASPVFFTDGRQIILCPADEGFPASITGAVSQNPASRFNAPTARSSAAQRGLDDGFAAGTPPSSGGSETT